tara:strand:- start:492 stop:824 length:333 start_codon:yes stop_codon:yes gene_type:complete
MVKKLIIIFQKCLFISLISMLIFQNVEADEIFNEGKKIFLEKGNCAMCHTLADAKSNGVIGPNLNEIKPDMMRVVNAVTNGIGVMPAFQGILTEHEIEAVAKYVSKKSDQ